MYDLEVYLSYNLRVETKSLKSIFSFLRKHRYLLILIIILLISLFFRTYQLNERFNYDHDSDLASWIVKDVVVNKHFRLIGQLTSAPGIFIGPFFYYLLIPFYLLYKMDPLGGVWLITILGVLTTLSYYFVFSKLFNKEVGFLGAFFQAASLSSIYFDRRVVPSTPTNLWIIWFFYIVVMISRGNYTLLPLLGVLIGLIWHIHIALLPALIAIPAAFLVSRKIPSLKQISFTLCTFTLTSLPLILFELRHNFMQSINLISNFATNHGGSTGIDKLNLIALMLARNILSLIFAPITLPSIDHRIIVTFFLLIIVTAVAKRLISIRDFFPLAVWIIGVIVFFTFSSSLVSEYYFSSIEVIYLAILSLILVKIFHISHLSKIVILGILILFFAKGAFYYVTTSVYQKGYVARKAAAEYILKDSKQRGFPCVGISYITTPGENVGFRYFFYLNNLKTIRPSLDVPVYTIVIPEELVKDDVKARFGHIGIIPPNRVFSKENLAKSCSGENTNLTDSMLGYTE